MLPVEGVSRLRRRPGARENPAVAAGSPQLTDMVTPTSKNEELPQRVPQWVHRAIESNGGGVSSVVRAPDS